MTESDLFIDETEALLGHPLLSEPLSQHPDILSSEDIGMRMFAYGACLRILAEARANDRQPVRSTPDYETTKWNGGWATTQRLAKLAFDHKQELASLWRQVELAEHANNYLLNHWDKFPVPLTDEERMIVKKIITSLNHPFDKDSNIKMNEQQKRERHTEIQLPTSIEESRLPAAISQIVADSSLHNTKRVLHVVSSDEIRDHVINNFTQMIPHVSVSTLRKGTAPSSLANTVVITSKIFGKRFKKGYIDNFYPIDFIMIHRTSSDIQPSQDEAFLARWHGPSITVSYTTPSSSIPQHSLENVTTKKPTGINLFNFGPRTHKPAVANNEGLPPKTAQPKDDKITSQPEKKAPIPEEEVKQNHEPSAEQSTQTEPLFTLLKGYSISQEQAAIKLCRAGLTLQVTYDEMDGNGWLVYSCPPEAKAYIKEHFGCFLMPTEEEIAAQFKVPVELVACVTNSPAQNIKAQFIKRNGKGPGVWCYDNVELEKIKKALNGPSGYNIFILATGAMADREGITYKAAWQAMLASSSLLANHDLPPTKTEVSTIKQGEKPLAIIAKEVGISYRTAEQCIHPEEMRHIKEKIYQDETGKERAGLAIPSSKVWQITERLKKHRPQKLPAQVLPAYLIERIVRDYSAVPTENINKTINSAGSRWKTWVLGTAEDSHRVDCLDWHAIAHLVEVRGKAKSYPIAAIDYSRLPMYIGDLNPDRIKYAQEIQRRLLKPDELQKYGE